MKADTKFGLTVIIVILLLLWATFFIGVKTGRDQINAHDCEKFLEIEAFDTFEEIAPHDYIVEQL